MEEFFSGNYMPHGMCFLWKPSILWLNVFSDAFIALAYFSIPVLILTFMRRRPDIQFRGLFVLFASFILWCGITHLFSIYNIWHGSYGWHGITKLITAVVSVTTALVLIRKLPFALSLPTPAQLAHAERQALEEKLERNRLELERKNEAIFKFSMELLPTGLLVIDANQKIRLANKALEKMFGYEANELEGKSLDTLLTGNMSEHHKLLVEDYLNHPQQRHSMAAGRIVRGKAKNGDEISIEISLSAHDFEGEKHAFASVVDISKVISEQSLFLESSNRLKRAVEASNDGIWEWNVQTNDVWYSPRFMRMIGKGSKVKPEFADWENHIHPDDRKMIREVIEAHITHKQKYDVVYRGISESGEYEWMHTRGDTIFDHQGNPLLMSGTLSNINELKMLESELSQKTYFLNAVLDKSLCGTYIFDLQSQKNIYINAQYTGITGYTSDDLEAMQSKEGLMPLFHPDDREKIIQHFDDVVKSKEKRGVTIEYRFRHKTGRWLWCYSLDSVYSYDARGRPVEMIGTFFEITDLKEREERIKKLALDFLMTFEQAAVGIAHITLEGLITKANKKICDILGYSHGALIDKPFNDICQEDDLYDYIESVQNSSGLPTGQYLKECQFIKNGGEFLWVNLTLSLVRNDEGKNLHFVAVVEDISERKKVERELEESNMSLERFAYSASHDLQEPLRKICAFSDSLEYRLKDTLDDPDACYELNRISDAATRMREMINSLLQLARFSRQKYNKEGVILSALVQLVKEDLSTLIGETQANIELHNDEVIHVDRTAMQQVLMNLVKNSIRYAMPNMNPTIIVSCETQQEFSILRVADNGRGFDQSNAEKIFEPFKRLVGKDIPGTGMGLALCRQIVSAHGGAIEAVGEVGKGAIFTIKLPRGSQS